MTDAHAIATVTPPALEELVGTAEVPVLVDLWAEWCGPCHLLARELATVAGERAGTLEIVSLDTDEHPEVALRYEALSVPTLLLFDRGELVARFVGARPAARLLREVDEALSIASS